MTKSGKRGNLTHLNLNLSDGGCLSCQHCWLHPTPDKETKPGQFLDYDNALQAVEEALPLGLHAVRLCGNATIRYPHFDALINLLESKRLVIQIETNGSGLTSQRAGRLALLPSASASISLHGADPATHDSVTGQPGTFDTATQAIRLLTEVGIPVQIFFPVTRSNASQLEGLIRLAEKQGAASIRFVMVQPALYNSRVATERLPAQKGRLVQALAANSPQPGLLAQSNELRIQEMIMLGRRIERELANTTRVQLLVDHPPAFRGLQPSSRSQFFPRCGILNTISVHAGGDFTLCSVGRTHPQLILGHIGVDDLAQIWQDHPMLQQLRDGMPHRLEGICERCVMKAVCMGNCATENYFRTGSFWSANWFCSAAEQAGLFPAGRLIENQR